MTRFGEICPACGSAEHHLALPLDRTGVWRCRTCGLGRTIPPPPEADGHECFSRDRTYFEQAYAQPKDRWWQRFTEDPLNFLESAGAQPGLRLLDVGCNLGYLVAAAGRRGFRASGLDASPAAVAFGREQLGLDLTCARIEEALVGRGSQDIVVLNHVLEHVMNPREILQRVRHWLKPAGFLLLAVPNIGSPIARMAGARWAGLVLTQHLWHFTPPALVRLVGSTGFTQIRWRTRMMIYAPASLAEWAKWTLRRVLEPLRLADNLLLIARTQAGGDRQ
jgi:SAM-dependent methyltransferase